MDTENREMVREIIWRTTGCSDSLARDAADAISDRLSEASQLSGVVGERDRLAVVLAAKALSAAVAEWERRKDFNLGGLAFAYNTVKAAKNNLDAALSDKTGGQS